MTSVSLKSTDTQSGYTVVDGKTTQSGKQHHRQISAFWRLLFTFSGWSWIHHRRVEVCVQWAEHTKVVKEFIWWEWENSTLMAQHYFTPRKPLLSWREGSSLPAHGCWNTDHCHCSNHSSFKHQLWGFLHKCPPSGMLLHFVQAINTGKQVYNPESLSHM